MLAVLMAFAVMTSACGSNSGETRTATPEPASGTEAALSALGDTTEARES